MIDNALLSTARKARAAMRAQKPRLQNLALDLGLVSGHMDYTRFIILARSRTGSNFLRGLLNSHTGVRVFGEIFQNPNQVDFAVPHHVTTSRMLEQYQRNPVRFVADQVFRRMPRHLHAVGFKLFYYHAQTEPWRAVWPYLQDMTQLKIIHLKRRNMLSTHLSRIRAERSDRWVNISGDKEDAGPIELNVDECRADFERTWKWEAEADEFFQDHAMVELYYEDLAHDTDLHIAQLQSFLGLPAQKLTAQTYKQSRQPFPASISNYAELKRGFAGTRWEAFFED